MYASTCLPCSMLSKLLSLTAQHTHEDLHRCSLHQCSWLLVQVYKGIKNGVQDVAVKVLANADETQLRLFEQEIKMMKQVSFDRNIVQVRCSALWQVSVLAGRVLSVLANIAAVWQAPLGHAWHNAWWWTALQTPCPAASTASCLGNHAPP